MANGGSVVLETLEHALEGHEHMAISKAANEMREIFRQNEMDYNTTMREVGGQLIDLIRLAPEKFKLVERPHGSQT